MLIKYIRESFKRKYARRVFREYPTCLSDFHLEKDGKIQFATWKNPLRRDEYRITTPMVEFYRKYISEGDLVIDIGANIGDTTVPMGLAAGKAGTTLGFDPNPVVFKILEINSALNRDKTNIIPLRYAISVEDEEFYFVSSEASFSNGGISKTKKSSLGRYIYPEKISGVNLIDFLNQNYNSLLPRFSFIKIDTEGYDKEIIKSVSPLIEKYRPVIVAESYDGCSRNEKLDLYDTISDLNYNISYFSDFDINAEVIELKGRKDILKWRKTINIICLPG